MATTYKTEDGGASMVEKISPSDFDMVSRNVVPIKRLKQVLIGVFAFTILLGGYGGWWYLVASHLKKNISMWIEQQSTKGVTINFEMMTQKGFPGPVHLSIKKPKILKYGRQSWSWSGDILNLSLNPWAINHLTLDVKGLHQLKLHKPDGLTTYEGSAENCVGTVTLKDGDLDQINININALEIKNVSVNDNLQVKQADIDIFEISEYAPSFKLRIRDMELPITLKSPLGRDVRHMDAKGHFTGGLQLSKWPGFLAIWRDGGGALDFKSLDLDYPPLRVKGDGTVALDSKMQPIGAFSLKVGGMFETVDVLYDQGLIPLGTLFATKFALNILNKKPVDGNNSYLNIALTLQDQTLYVGNVKVLKIAPIQW
jgi:hypothetical protein